MKKLALTLLGLVMISCNKSKQYSYPKTKKIPVADNYFDT